MKKFLSAGLAAILLVIAMCSSTSAASTYAYDDKSSTLGMELTSALYTNRNGEDVDVTGITRVDTYSNPTYTTFTMYSTLKVTYQYSASSSRTRSHEAQKEVSNIGSHDYEYIREHGFEGVVSYAEFLQGTHVGTAKYGSRTFLSAKVDSTSVNSLRNEAEIARLYH